MGRTFSFSERVLQVVTLHFFWILFMLRGFIVAGFFPSTAALYAVIRELARKKSIQSISVLYKKHYKDNFKVSNVLGWLFLLVTLIIITNYIYIPLYSDVVRLVMYTIIFLFTFLLLIIWTYFFPVITQYKLSYTEYFVMIFRMGFASLSALIVQILILGIYFVLIYLSPALLLLIGIVPLVYIQLFVSKSILQLNKLP